MELLDGKKISNQIKEEIAAEVAQMKARGEKVPHLAFIWATSAAISSLIWFEIFLPSKSSI